MGKIKWVMNEKTKQWEREEEKYIIWKYSVNDWAVFLRTKNNDNDITTEPRRAYIFSEREAIEMEKKYSVNKVNIKVFDLNLGLEREMQDELFTMIYVKHDDLLEIMRKERCK